MYDCWLYLDCYILTGYSFENCPNKKACEHNAKHSHNTSSFLPYDYYVPNKLNPLYEISTLIVEPYLEQSAKEQGYATAINLFYFYEDKALIIGKKHYGDSLAIPKKALNLGFAEAENIPYEYKYKKDKTGEYGLLTVKTDYDNYAFFQDLGWFDAVELPYNIRYDLDIGAFLHVEFNSNDFRYLEAIKLGWHRSSYWDYHRAMARLAEKICKPVNDTENDIPF